MNLTIPQLVELLTHGGSVAVIVLLYVGYTRERTERMEMTKLVVDMVKQVAEATTKQTAATQAHTTALSSYIESVKEYLHSIKEKLDNMTNGKGR